MAHTVTFTRAVPILAYEPEAVITLSPGMAGTLKLCVPELPEVADLVGVADLLGVADLVGAADLVGVADLAGVAETLGTAEFVAAAEVAGVAEGPRLVESPDGEDGPDGADKAVAESPEDAEDAAVGEFPPIPAHAVRPVPATTTAMITADTRHIRIRFYPSASN
ncbi:MAG TPA: hypothetical protein VGM12_11920 [Trebonia sp.]